MRVLQALSTIFLLIGIGFFTLDLMHQWAVHNELKILSFEDVWMDLDKDSYATVKAAAESVMPPSYWHIIASTPAFIFILAFAAIFYVPFKICDMIRRKLQDPAK